MQQTSLATAIVEQPKRQMVRELPASEHPVNRLQAVGPLGLSTVETIAAVIQTPDAVSLAAEIYAHFGSLMRLTKATLTELCRFPGVGPATATRIKAAIELGRRLHTESPEELPQISSPADAANLIMADMALLDQEQMWVLVLNTKNYVITIDKVYQGSVNASLIRISELFRQAELVQPPSARMRRPSLLLTIIHRAGVTRLRKIFASQNKSSRPASSSTSNALIT